MNKILKVGFKFLLIITAIITGILIYYTLVVKYILTPLCLVNSNECLYISYWNYNNSALIHMEPVGYWIWFNGSKAYIYNVDGENTCLNNSDGTSFKPAFPLDMYPEAQPEPWLCIQDIESLIDLYENKLGVTKKFIYNRIPNNSTSPSQGDLIPPKKIKGPVSLSAKDILNIMENKNILNFTNINK